MFVIMQSLDNLGPNERKANNIPQNIGQTMKHAGVAITVTSMTDIVVFAVGSSTVSSMHIAAVFYEKKIVRLKASVHFNCNTYSKVPLTNVALCSLILAFSPKAR